MCPADSEPPVPVTASGSHCYPERERGFSDCQLAQAIDSPTRALSHRAERGISSSQPSAHRDREIPRRYSRYASDASRKDRGYSILTHGGVVASASIVPSASSRLRADEPASPGCPQSARAQPQPGDSLPGATILDDRALA